MKILQRIDRTLLKKFTQYRLRHQLFLNWAAKSAEMGQIKR